MIDHNGEEWATVNEAAADVRVRPGTIYVWASRPPIIVRSHRIGAHRYVSMVDVRHAEKAWRSRLVTTT